MHWQQGPRLATMATGICDGPDRVKEAAVESYGNQDLTREQVDVLPGPILLVFGTNW